MEGIKYELDKEAVIEELKKIEGTKAVKFDLFETYYPNDDWTIGAVEVLIDNPNRENLSKKGAKYTEDIIYDKLKVPEEVMILIVLLSNPEIFKNKEGEYRDGVISLH